MLSGRLVGGADTQYSFNTGDWQQWTDTQVPTIAPAQPTGISAGDLLLVMTTAKGPTAPTGWTLWEDDGPCYLFIRIADESANDIFSATYDYGSPKTGHAHFAVIQGVGATALQGFVARTFVQQTVSGLRYKVTTNYDRDTDPSGDAIIAVVMSSMGDSTSTSYTVTGGPTKFSDGSAANIQELGSDNVIDGTAPVETMLTVWGFQLNKNDPTRVIVEPGQWTRSPSTSKVTTYVTTGYRFSM